MAVTLCCLHQYAQYSKYVSRKSNKLPIYREWLYYIYGSQLLLSYYWCLTVYCGKINFSIANTYTLDYIFIITPVIGYAVI